jgi:4-hydroxy-2-oxoheptanedioate aldolase
MRVDLVREFRKKLREGYVLGPFAKTCDPAFIEIIGRCGFDFVIIDLEHGPVNVQTAGNLIRAAEASGTLPIVRTKEDRLSTIGEVLDLGACGIQAPQVTDADSAETILEHARFAPDGMRGVCRFVRSADYSSMDRQEYFRDSNEALVITQLEGTEALSNLEGILAVHGIDIVFIGPYDLSQSLGVPGQVDHPLVIEEMKKIVETCRKNEIATGTFVDTMADARRWIDAGVSYISYSVDVGLFTEVCATTVKAIRGDE